MLDFFFYSGPNPGKCSCLGEFTQRFGCITHKILNPESSLSGKNTFLMGNDMKSASEVSVTVILDSYILIHLKANYSKVA